VTAQIAISLVLLVTAGLFLHSLRNATSIDLGFKPESVETVGFDLETQGLSAARGQEFYAQLIERVSALPGVRSASLARMVPLNGSNMKVDINLTGQELPTGERVPVVGLNVVDTRYFNTLEIPLVYGRAFNETDRQDAPRSPRRETRRVAGSDGRLRRRQASGIRSQRSEVRGDAVGRRTGRAIKARCRYMVTLGRNSTGSFASRLGDHVRWRPPHARRHYRSHTNTLLSSDF